MTKTCTRCKGKGFFRESAGVMFAGVPGLCYGCGGAGTHEAQLKMKADAIAAKTAGMDKFIHDLKVQAFALYDAYELGYISERKRDRRIDGLKLELRSAGVTNEQYQACKVDEVALKLATEAMNK